MNEDTVTVYYVVRHAPPEHEPKRGDPVFGDLAKFFDVKDAARHAVDLGRDAGIEARTELARSQHPAHQPARHKLS